jgi:hypothetical protein
LLITIAGNRLPPKRELNQLIGHSPKHLVVLISDRMFMARYLFDVKGYRLVITEAGIDHALQRVSTYAAHIDFDRFMASWDQNAKLMRAIHAGDAPS